MKKILVVDDDDEVRATIVEQLAPIGAEITDVSDARQAIRLISVQKFDIILSDLFMPEVDGMKFISEVRRIEPNIPFVLVSGGGALFPVGSRIFADLAKAAEILGASQILEKPFSGRRLREVVRSLLEPEPPLARS
jgi:two-component system C4-dicarboxylate transport response regulator DctD